MISDKEIWLDVDGVLLDWVRSFLNWLGKFGIEAQYEDITEYTFSNIYPDKEKFQHDIKYFNKTPMYARLKPLADFADLERLKTAGYTLNVITQISEDDVDVKLARIQNLNQNFPGLLNSFEFTYPGQCKLEKLRELRPHGRIIVVEDNPSFLKKANATTEHDMHHKGRTDLFTFAIMHPYNREILKTLPFVVQVPSMKEVTQIIYKLEGLPYVE